MHSNTSLNCFANCQRKYKLCYIDGIKPETVSPHLTFGMMAHDVLYKAGKLRDDVADKVVNDNDYYDVIPSETLYPELKDFFKIDNWHQYFVGVIKQIANYEADEIDDIIKETGDNYNGLQIYRELKLSIKAEDVWTMTNAHIPKHWMDGLTGVIDLLLLTSTHAYIFDYKFSDNKKSQSDFDENSQLQLYAYLVHVTYDIPLHNIKIGYIDIPKKVPNKPVLLSNGTLSRAKSQNCTAEMYKLYVEALHGKEDPVYNCNKGGYYYDCYMELQNNKTAYLTARWLDLDVYCNIIGDLSDAIVEIDTKRHDEYGGKWLRKYDSYSCKNCEYKKHCKPWLTEVW